MTILTLIITLQVINISIDPLDKDPAKEDLSINEIESCVEFILEVCLGNSNAVKEHDEHDESPFKTRTISLLLFAVDSQIIFNDKHFDAVPLNNFSYLHCIFQSPDKTIQSPPPKA